MNKIYKIGSFFDKLKMLFRCSSPNKLYLVHGFLTSLYDISLAHRQDTVFPFYQSYDLIFTIKNNWYTRYLFNGNVPRDYYETAAIPKGHFEFEIIDNKIYIKE